MERINFNYDANIDFGNYSAALEDLNCKSIEEWEGLSKEDQTERLQSYLDGFAPIYAIVEW